MLCVPVNQAQGALSRFTFLYPTPGVSNRRTRWPSRSKRQCGLRCQTARSSPISNRATIQPHLPMLGWIEMKRVCLPTLTLLSSRLSRQRGEGGKSLAPPSPACSSFPPVEMLGHPLQNTANTSMPGTWDCSSSSAPYVNCVYLPHKPGPVSQRSVPRFEYITDA